MRFPHAPRPGRPSARGVTRLLQIRTYHRPPPVLPQTTRTFFVCRENSVFGKRTGVFFPEDTVLDQVEAPLLHGSLAGKTEKRQHGARVAWTCSTAPVCPNGRVETRFSGWCPSSGGMQNLSTRATTPLQNKRCRANNQAASQVLSCSHDVAQTRKRAIRELRPRLWGRFSGRTQGRAPLLTPWP